MILYVISSNEYFNLASIAVWFLVAINNECEFNSTFSH